MARELPHNLVYRTAGRELNIATDGSLTIVDSGRTRESKLSDKQLEELGALLEFWEGIRLRFWLLRAWTIDESDVSITYAGRTIYSCDLKGRNSSFWHLEHFLNHLLASFPRVDLGR